MRWGSGVGVLSVGEERALDGVVGEVEDDGRGRTRGRQECMWTIHRCGLTDASGTVEDFVRHFGHVVRRTKSWSQNSHGLRRRSDVSWYMYCTNSIAAAAVIMVSMYLEIEF